MKKKDMILIVAVLAISLISLAAIKMTQKDGKEVRFLSSFLLEERDNVILKQNLLKYLV